MKKIWIEIYREMFAEFISIFVLTTMQTALIATVIISGKTDNPLGNGLSTALGCGLAVMIAVYIGGGVSGAHVNPAVTSTFAIMGKLPWIKVPFYFLAQYLGAFMGAAVTHIVYKDAMLNYNGPYADLAGIWTTFPAKFLSAGNAMLDSTFASALLMILVLAICDRKNMDLPFGTSPFFIGLLVTIIGMGFSYNCGNPMNPARDLGPRIWAVISGHGPDVLVGSNSYIWWWIPVVFPHIGCLIGAFIYEVLIEFHHPDDSDVVVSEGGSNRKSSNSQLMSVDPITRSSVILELAKCAPSSVEMESLISKTRQFTDIKENMDTTSMITAL